MLRDYYARDSHDNDLLAIIIAAFDAEGKPDVSPLTYSETVDYVTFKLKEGLFRGENCASLLKVAVVEAIPLDPAFDAHIDKSWNESIDFYKNQWPNFHVCAKCRTLAQKDSMVCLDCASGKDRFENLRSK